MRTDYELVEALKAMYHFLGGDGRAHHSSNEFKSCFSCGFSSDNKILIDAILKAADIQGKTVTCKYDGSVVNIVVNF